jgi:hypothetical protein
MRVMAADSRSGALRRDMPSDDHHDLWKNRANAMVRGTTSGARRKLTDNPSIGTLATFVDRDPGRRR